MKIMAAVVHGKGEKIALEAVDLTPPKEGEVLVRIKATGICHTELGIQHQHIQTPLPIVLGHEGAGVIEQIGANVTEFAVGDHVVITFASCAQCDCCLAGYPNSCEHFGVLNFGGHMLDGGTRLSIGGRNVANLFGQSSLATHTVVHVNNVVKVDQDLDLTLLGPLACGVQTGVGTVVNRLKPGFGDSIVVFGCGSVGLSAIMGAALTGCRHIIAVDVQAGRLELAHSLGATHTVNSRETDPIAEIKCITGSGANYAVESTGLSAVVLQSIHCLKPRGTVAIVGVSGNTTINIHDDLIPPNRTLMGVTQGDSNPKVFIPKLIEYYRAGKLPFDRLIKTYSFDALDTALEDMRTGVTIKPVIVFDSSN